ncbi:prostaglandin E2 receptor EP2 subtype-like [Amblyraja radiata]|uniref:prostaglandin E2 receptor EP2 subtype-like n=1 Tax=Amblyraja radiata TaxID=386614 RepID=UPI0014024E34|nr:prostaglandin E2 receptor EP2 subtype-like [Amblyraja radiata]XP_032883181.1 prostaglandin E2 receptor EP2 subtype-like [Amblyraja radiata]XP_032883182.1 prostaglandin E2 receptor EP2 subtype-like [Amblyraja radiata]
MEPPATSNGSCENTTKIDGNAGPAMSAVMFGAGVLGNLLALAALAVHKRNSRNKMSLFYILVSSLITADLVGTLIISPMVLTAYSRGRTLEDLQLCNYCAFALSFFGLSSMFILFAMALERCLSLSCPYFYQRHISNRCGLVAVPAICIFCLLFCALPLLGFGLTAQYCPGTWCFIKMGVWGEETKHRVYSLSYAVLLKVLIVSTLLCNVSVIFNLCRMYRRHKSRRHSTVSGARRRDFSQSEEVQHLALLAIMTTTFVICSVPITIRAYIGAFYVVKDRESDLLALRCLSFNSIIDPWVFIIFNTSTSKRILSRILCCKSTSNRQYSHATTFKKTETIAPEPLFDRHS